MRRLGLSFLAALVLMTWAQGVLAKDLGVLGKTYPIQESNLITVLKNRWQAWQGAHPDFLSDWQQRVRHYAEVPDAVAGITPAKHTISRVFDPSITLSQPILGAQGEVLVPKGTHINPLADMTLRGPLYLIDGTREKELVWLKKRLAESGASGLARVILVRGAVPHAREVLAQDVYFDQRGALSTRLHVHHTPTRIAQMGQRLLVEEYAL